MTKDNNAEETARIKHANLVRGADPETAAHLVELGVLTPEAAQFWVDQRQRIAGTFSAWAQAERLRPAGGRPPNTIDRDQLIYCLRECYRLEYYRIDEILAEHDLPVPKSSSAHYKAHTRGKHKLGITRGQACKHTEAVDQLGLPVPE